MTNVFKINVVPASRSEWETFDDIENEFSGLIGVGKGAVFGQLHVGHDVPTLKGHIFTGDAMKYLEKHILKAVDMQTKQSESVENSGA